ncbi:MAG: VOC family protein [Actinomycetota bacterium]
MPRPIHFEFHGDDPEAAVEFYSTVFGWRSERWGEMPYWLQYTGEDGPGIDGAIAPAEEHGQLVVITMGVDDLDASIEKVKSAGGKITQERMPIPGVGWFAMGSDPNGLLFGMMQEDPAAGT